MFTSTHKRYAVFVSVALMIYFTFIFLNGNKGLEAGYVARAQDNNEKIIPKKWGKLVNVYWNFQNRGRQEFVFVADDGTIRITTGTEEVDIYKRK